MERTEGGEEGYLLHWPLLYLLSRLLYMHVYIFCLSPLEWKLLLSRSCLPSTTHSVMVHKQARFLLILDNIWANAIILYIDY